MSPPIPVEVGSGHIQGCARRDRGICGIPAFRKDLQPGRRGERLEVATIPLRP